jgi:hypothetical protein
VWQDELVIKSVAQRGYLSYDRLHLYSMSLGQEKYLILRDWFAGLEQVAGKETASFHSAAEEIMPLESLDKKERSLMIFDDVMLEKQGPIEKYFCQGRHGGADCSYLTQNYFRIPKQAIRDNANLVVLFNQDGKNLRSIHDAFVGGDIPFDEFRAFCQTCCPGIRLRRHRSIEQAV